MITDQLRAAIQAAIERGDATLYSLAKDADLDYYTVARFASGERPDIRSSSVDRLCARLALELTVAGDAPRRSDRGRRRLPKAPRG